MATLVLGAVGSALGAGFGGTILGLTGSAIGGLIGSTIGAVADRYIVSALTPNTTTANVGPRLVEVSLMSSAEGSAMPRAFGRARLNTQLIWATQFKETISTTSSTQGGGKGGGGGRATTTNTSYSYSISFAVAICEGNSKAQLGRVWLNGNETDLSSFTFRFYSGSETQAPDPLIQATEGVDFTPAFRGTSYLVFQDLPIADYGNRIPQVTVEVVVPLDTTDPDDLLNLGTGFQLIPSSGETVYATSVYAETSNSGAVTQNRHNNFNRADAAVAIDQLDTFMTNLDTVSIVVAWFGTDLRADQCRIIPKVESNSRELTPSEWSVAGYTRATAEEVSLLDGKPVFGGTPSDDTLLELVAYLTSLGKRVVFYPFILMDIPTGNTLPNPYSNGAAGVGQVVLPWRGRITCSPAIGYSGTPDKTSGAATQINTWFTRTEGYRAMVLHYANLLAGTGVDAFIIGSELVGLTTVRGASNTFPAVSQLVTLASDVSTILGAGVKISYAADWSEYHSYRPSDGSNDVYFNMDPLWASSDIDFIGIDNYLPMSDWRDGQGHLDFDAVNGPVSEYDLTYLKSNIEGGEYFDWFYASDVARATQTRTAIADVAYGKPWTFRQKDLRNWWLNSHVNRPGGTESGATSWAAQSKPFWFTEFGCPAVNRGTNQPNVFYDPKSSESFFPYNSNGERDDFIQRQYLEAMLQYWRDNAPTSGVYADKMVKPADMLIWTWDARPFPAYPARTDVWSDGALWNKGHWLTGRIDGVPLKRLVAWCCQKIGLQPNQYDVSGLDVQAGLIRGFYVSNLTTERELLETLARFCQFTAVESEGKLKFVGLANTKRAAVLDTEDLALPEGQSYVLSLTRKQEIDLPNRVDLTFLDELEDFKAASVGVQKGTGTSQDGVSFSFPMVSTDSYMSALALSYLFQEWQARDSGVLSLPPSYVRVEPGDYLDIPVATGRRLDGRVLQLDVTKLTSVEFAGFDSSLFTFSGLGGTNGRLPKSSATYNSAVLAFMDLPLISDVEGSEASQRVAAYASPWPGSVNLYRADGTGGYLLVQQLASNATLGDSLNDLYRGPTGVWDRGNVLNVRLYRGGLTSQTKEQLLASNGNALAIQSVPDGPWEVLQFATATLTSPGVYALSDLLRGQLGTEDVMSAVPYATGARVVILEPAFVEAMQVSAEVARLPTVFRWGPSTYAPNDVTYLQATETSQLRGLRPYAPGNARLHRISGSGNVVLSWTRRTRLNGDGWEQTEVPLNEETEQYQIVVLTGPAGTVKRTVVTSVPTWTYLSADQVTDFGSAQTQIYVQISQYGAAFGNYGGVFEGYVYMGSST